MVERGDGSRFAQKAVRKLLGAELNRHIAIQGVSRALHTSPIPPLPMAETISYEPSFSPGLSSMLSAKSLQSAI
jgi:hypothetical protein